MLHLVNISQRTFFFFVLGNKLGLSWNTLKFFVLPSYPQEVLNTGEFTITAVNLLGYQKLVYCPSWASFSLLWQCVCWTWFTKEPWKFNLLPSLFLHVSTTLFQSGVFFLFQCHDFIADTQLPMSSLLILPLHDFGDFFNWILALKSWQQGSCHWKQCV